MTRRPVPTRVVVDRVVVHGVPATGLDPLAVSTAIHESLPALLSERMRGESPVGPRRVDAHRRIWSPATGPDALNRAVADGLADAIGGRDE